MSKKLSLYLAIFALMTTIVACTSIEQRASEALDRGDVDGALGLYSEWATREPHSSEAHSGLLKVRKLWLDKKLIQVRLSRLAGNNSEADQILRNLIQRQNQWSVFPEGAVYSTQKEEVALFSQRTFAQIEQEERANRPLRAMAELQNSETLLSMSDRSKVEQSLRRVAESSRKFCRAYANSRKDTEHFSVLWATDLCASLGLRLAKRETQSSVQLFSNVEVSAQVQGLEPQLGQKLAESVRAGVRATRWFVNDGKGTMTLSLGGNFVSQDLVSDTPVTATYPVEVPYDYIHKEPRKANESSLGQSGLGIFFAVLAAAANSASRQVDNGDGTVTVHETRYRTEYKDFIYYAKETAQRKNLQIALTGGPSGDLKSREFKWPGTWENQFSRKAYEHNVTFAEANIYPRKDNLVTDAQWIQETQSLLTKHIQGTLSQFWYQQFCPDELGELDDSQKGEWVHRCLYGQPPQIPRFVDRWFQHELGLSYDDYQAAVAIARRQSVY